MPWFAKLLFSDSVIGPLSDEQIKSLANTGQLAPGSEVAKSATGPWFPASRVKGLFETTISAQPEASLSPAAMPVTTTETPNESRARDPAFPTVQQGMNAIREKTRAYVQSQALDEPITAKDPLVVVVWKLIRGAKEFSFHNNDFPALSACLRIGASLARWWFCLFGVGILLFGIMLVLEPAGDTLAAWCNLTGTEAENYIRRTSDGIKVEAHPFLIVWALLLHCVRFVAIMGGLEFMRVVLAIEKNTRVGGRA